MATILLIEDNPDIRECLADVLLETGHTVVQASDGVDAFAKLDQIERPSLIVLDLSMPGMGGLEFLDRLRKHPRDSDLSVLLMSGDWGPTGVENRPGVVGTLRKPFDVSQLLARVKAHC